MTPLQQSLLITVIGMGLVFILIIFLWGFMAVMVSVSNRYDFMALTSKEDEDEESGGATETAGPELNKPGIVAVAIAAAIAAGQRTFHITPSQPSETSSWQAVARANILAQISTIYNRKPRG
jgi:sodium pump decarboxylase gamma subunit